MDDMTLDLTIF